MRKRRYTQQELKAKIYEDAQKNGMAPTFEILQRRLHIGYTTLRKLGTLREIYVSVGIDPGLPTVASQFESSVYALLLEFFKPNDIVYQKTFAECRTKRLLPFDFYIKSINLIVEADGTQHYADGKAGWGDRCRTTDAIKNKFCCENGIALLRIRFRRFKWCLDDLRDEINKIQLHAQEIGHANCFNCWDGSGLIPISSEADIKHKKQRKVHIAYNENMATYKVDTVEIKLDAAICKNLNCGLYIKNNKVYRSDTGLLMANYVLNIKGVKGARCVTYNDGNPLNLCKSNLVLRENKELPRSKRGAYKNSRTGSTLITWSSTTIKGKIYNSYVVKFPSGKKKYINVAKFSSKEEALQYAYSLLPERSTTIPEGSTDEANASGNGQHRST